MPTTLPRIKLTVSPEFDAAISDLAALTRQSKSRTIMDVLEPATPFFQELARLIRTQKEIKEEPSRQLQANLEGLMQRMTSGLPMTNRALTLMAELAKEMEQAEAAGTDEDPTPRSVTRGADFSPPSQPSPSSLPSFPPKPLS